MGGNGRKGRVGREEEGTVQEGAGAQVDWRNRVELGEAEVGSQQNQFRGHEGKRRGAKAG